MITATHKASGHVGEIQQTHVSDDETFYYFEDHARPTAAGWYPASALDIPGVTS